MAQPTLTESPDRQPSARERDQSSQNIATEVRLAELRSSRSETSVETPQSQESSQENLNPEQIENKLGTQKAEQTKPNATDKLMEKGLDLGAKAGKKAIITFIWPYLLGAIGILIGIFVVCLVGFAMASVISCVKEKGYTGVIWDYVFRDGFTTTLKDSFNGTCGLLKNTAPKTITETPKTPESSSVVPATKETLAQ